MYEPSAPVADASVSAAEELIRSLKTRGVMLWAQEGRLRYSAPRGGLDAAEIESIRAYRRQILDLVERGNAGDGRETAARSRPRSHALPLSFAQERLWFLSQLGLENGLYHIPVPLRIEGELDERALLASLEALIARHESLRTRFAELAGEGVQYVQDHATLPFERADLSALLEEEREKRLRETLVEEIQRPFALNEAPLMRAMLVKTAEREHVLLLTFHHIVSDGWSLLVVLPKELAALYEANVRGKAPVLQPLPMQYPEYALWQRDQLSGEKLDRQLAYWRRQLRDVPALALPTDRPRPATPTYRGATVPVKFGASLTRAVRELARREAVTPFMVVLSALQWVLSRAAAQEDVAIGTPIAGRTHPGSEGLIGFFVNTLVMRTKVDPAATVRQLLTRVKQVTMGAYAHQDVPFERLVADLQPTRDMSRQPLFQVLLALHNVPHENFSLTGARVSWLPQPAVTAKFDLTLHLFELPEGFTGYCDYATDLFEASTVERLVAQWIRLLEGIVDNPDAALADLPLIDEPERDLILHGWNQTARDAPVQRRIHEMFSQQAQATPRAIAAVCESESITYAELDARSTQLARYLIARGVQGESVIGLCMPRSIDLLVGLLGILKSGGAFLPLDPKYPRKRLAYMLADSGARLVLTHASLRGLLGETSDSSAICVDLEAAAIREHSCEPLEETADEDRLAYLIYTSGSTGEPKGVMGVHRAAVNYFRAIRDAYRLSAEDTVLQLTSISFDASIRDLLGPLLWGARICLLSEQQVSSAEAIHRAIRDQRVDTILSITPTLLRYLTESDTRHDTVRRICVSGEQLYGSDLGAARRTFGERAVVINHYGPAEATMTCSYHSVPLAEWERYRDSRVPIGRPIDNVRLYILDERRRPVPMGSIGELYIGGAGVTRGYIGRPELTALQFMTDPHVAGGRIYRSGDLARYRPDGVIELVGRRDHQVKLRGNRIEPGEVEAALLKFEDVGQAAVSVCTDASEEPQLVAWIAGKAGREPDRRAVRAKLAETLPQYMVPSAFVLLPALPLLPNGKIDRQALPVPRLRDTAEYVAARTATEDALARLWEELLRAERVGVTESFFELGGHSLLAMRMIARVRALFGTDVPLKVVFETPTVEGLASYIDGARERAAGARVYSLIARRGPGDDLPLSFGQKVFESIYDKLDHCEILHSWITQRLIGPLDLAALEDAFREIVRRHAALRMCFRRDDAGTPRLSVNESSDFEFDVVDRPADVNASISEAASRRFDLQRGPLLRVRIVRIAPEEHVLVLVVHHSVFDAWSFGVMARELAALYTSRVSGTPLQLPTLPIDLTDYTAWLRDWLAGEGGARSLEFWRKRIAGGEQPFELPVDDVPATAEGSAEFVICGSIPDTTLAALRELALREGTTLSAVVMAAFAIAMSRWSGRDDVFFDVNHPCRLQPEVQDLIGFIAEVWVMRARVERGCTFLDVLRQVLAASRECSEHTQVPLWVVFQELQKLPRTQPLLLTTFNYINRDFFGGKAGTNERLLGPGVRLEHMERPLLQASRFLAESTNKKLSVAILETRDSLSWSIEYGGHRFSPHSVRKFSASLAQLLGAAAADAHEVIQ